MQVPRPGTKSAGAVTYACHTAAATSGSLTHCASAGSPLIIIKRKKEKAALRYLLVLWK